MFASICASQQEIVEHLFSLMSFGSPYLRNISVFSKIILKKIKNIPLAEIILRA
jgi:hypothetical protein